MRFMTIFLSILMVIVLFVGMELTAWFTHKYIMHGFLWILHEDHHTREHEHVEWNDLFAFMFALPSFVLIYIGLPDFTLAFFAGVGIALYGLTYFLLHDVLVHHRLPSLMNPNHWYFRGIIRAHHEHHTGGANYGFVFMIPRKYFTKQ